MEGLCPLGGPDQSKLGRPGGVNASFRPQFTTSYGASSLHPHIPRDLNWSLASPFHANKPAKVYIKLRNGNGVLITSGRNAMVLPAATDRWNPVQIPGSAQAGTALLSYFTYSSVYALVTAVATGSYSYSS